MRQVLAYVSGLFLAALTTTTMVAQPFISGIDVSHHQGSINWNSVKNAGIEFAFTKATEGVDYVDPRFNQNMQGAAAAGVIIGPYHFCRIDSFDGVPFTNYDGSPFLPGTAPYIDAVSEANDFLDAIVPYYQTGSYLPPVADVEGLPDFSTYALEKNFISNWVQIFSDTINATLGTRPIIYTSKSGANTYYTPTLAAQHDLWEAWWRGTGTNNPPVASDTPLFGDWLFWQWTDSWSVPGIAGNVDGDVFEGTQAQLEQLRITLVPGSGGPFARVEKIEEFEAGEGYFKWGTNFSGSNFGLLAGTDAQRVTTHAHEGFASQEINVLGDSNDWFLRHVSGDSSPAANPATNLPFASDGYIGFWLRTDDPGVTVYLALDDLTSTIERSLGQQVIADGAWHLYEWNLSDDSQWNAWAGGANGVLDGATLTIDSIQFEGTGDAKFFLDSIAHNPDGSLLAALGDFDYDGDVDQADLHQWQAQYGTSSGASFDRGDADGDGDVDGADFLAWQRTYQPSAPSVLSAVPEPGSLLFVTTVLLFVCSIRFLK